MTEAFAINCGSATIDGGTAILSGGSTSILATTGDITIRNGADVTASGAQSDGIYAQSGSITIENATVKASANSYGIRAMQDLVCTNSTVTASTGQNGNYGILASNNLICTGSTIESEGTTMGVLVTRGRAELHNTQLTAKCQYAYGLNADTLTMTGTSEVHASTSDNGPAAVRLGAAPTTVAINEPAGGSFHNKSTDSAYPSFLLCDADGETAQTARLTVKQEEAPKAAIAFWSLSLEGNIGVNFYLDLDESILTDASAYLKTTVAGQTTEIPVSKAVLRNEGGKTYYGFQVEIYAKQMTEDIQLTLHYGDTDLDFGSYKARHYADYVITHPEAYTENARNLIINMLHYGAYAQIHFGYKTDELANANLAAADLASVTVETLSKYQKAPVEGFYATNLTLDSETTLRHYFNDNPNAVYSCGGQTLEAENRVVSGVTYNCVTVPNIAAKDLNTDYTITVTADGSSKAVAYSAMSYAWQVLSSGSFTSDTEDLVKALYLYNQAANTFFGG